jgi:hypothetical protein
MDIYKMQETLRLHEQGKNEQLKELINRREDLAQRNCYSRAGLAPMPMIAVRLAKGEKSE